MENTLTSQRLSNIQGSLLFSHCSITTCPTQGSATTGHFLWPVLSAEYAFGVVIPGTQQVLC